MLKPKEISEIMQLDGTMGGTTAILEMLVHQKAGTVYISPEYLTNGRMSVSRISVCRERFLSARNAGTGKPQA